MKHLAAIQIEFIKCAVSLWWQNLSWIEQSLYLRKHPHSKKIYTIDSKPTDQELQYIRLIKQQYNLKHDVKNILSTLNSAEKSVFLKKIISLQEYMNEDLIDFSHKLKYEMNQTLVKLTEELKNLDLAWRVETDPFQKTEKIKAYDEKRLEQLKFLSYFDFFKKHLFSRRVNLIRLDFIDLVKKCEMTTNYSNGVQIIFTDVYNWGKILPKEIFDEDRKNNYQKLLVN